MLHSSRGAGFSGPLPITLQEIVALFALRGIDDPQEREDYLYVLQQVDAAYLDALARKRERESKRG